MEAVIFVGIQATGKSTFYRERFFDTHVRINLDMLRTRRRERLLLEACIAGAQPFVVDNTNPTRAERARYVAPARAAGFRVVGYYFDVDPREALRRNHLRAGSRVVPPAGLFGTLKRLERPTRAEGFDLLYRATTDEAGTLTVEEWGGEG